MSLFTSHFRPSSPFYRSQTPSDRLNAVRCNPFVSHSPSSAYQRSSLFTDDILSRLDRIDVLGGPDSNGDEIGHRGCVNALAWSQSGHCLATGSDDRKVILWKLGSAVENPQSQQLQDVEGPRAFPKLDLAQADVIETGHRANIFNVKWAPNSSDSRLLTCAGDHQVRVFDLSRTSSSRDHRLRSGKEYRIWEEGQGACTRVLRCHSSRAKKISTENSPDVFLTAAEDGEVRQMDLRVPHTCSRTSQSYGRGCPRPLMQFQMELYSISISKLEPWLFAVAGTSNKVYLQDRRMIPRLLKEEWGARLEGETAALTHCVRRFTREKEVEGGTSEDVRSTRRMDRSHVTAVKISESNGRDLIASFSGDGVYRFDIKGDLGRSKKDSITMSHSSKRRKTSSGSSTPQSSKGKDDLSEWNRIRSQVLTWLFTQKEKDAGIRKRYMGLMTDLDRLSKSVQQSPRSSVWLATEQSVITLCKVLLYIKRMTNGKSESVDMRLQSHIEAMRKNMTGEAKTEFISLIEELEEANKWKAYSEEVKIRILLWDRAEEYIKPLWTERADLNAASSAVLQEDPFDPVVDTLDEINQSEGEGEIAASIHRRLEAITDLSSSSGGSGSESSEIDDDDVAMAMANLREQHREDEMELEEEEHTDEGNVDESEEEGDDDDDEPQFDEAESSEDEQSDRHGISGGTAPLVYPSSCYTGHANNETVKDCGFIGSNDEYIWTGSDCGHFFIWSNDDKGQLKGIWKGDGSVVNVLAQHPTLPICAVSGIDETVKIFGPVSKGSHRLSDALDQKEEIMRRNIRRERIGINSRSILHLFAQHLHASQGVPRRLAVEEGEEDEECIIV